MNASLDIPVKRFTPWFKENGLYWLASLLLPFIWFAPRFYNAKFGMIDDPDLLRIFSDAHANLGAWFSEFPHFQSDVTEGRMKPVSYLLNYFFYFVPARLNPFLWTAINYLFFAVALTCQFLFVRSLTGRKEAALLACGLWGLSASSILSWSRFFIQDHFQSVWIGIILLMLLAWVKEGTPKKKFVMGALLSAVMLGFYMTKETAIAVFPLSVIIFAGSLAFKKKRKEWGSFLAMNAVCFAVLFSLIPERAGYAEESLAFIPALMVHNVINYGLELQWHFLILACVVSYTVRMLGKIRSGLPTPQECWQFGLVVLAVGFIMPYIPWKAHVRRYLLISQFLFSIFVGMELWVRIQTLARYKKQIVAAAAVLALTSTSGWAVLVRHEYLRASWKGEVEGIRWFAAHAKPNARALIMVQEQELLQSFAIYLQRFFDRSDITIFTLSPYAMMYREKGFRIVPLRELDQATLSKIDYIFLLRRGVGRMPADKYHLKILKLLGVLTGSAADPKPLYEDLLYEYKDYPEWPSGVQIWRFPL